VLLMLNCPILALSATVGEPHLFQRWLQGIKSAQKEADSKNTTKKDQTYEVLLINYPQRYVDLRKHSYVTDVAEGNPVLFNLEQIITDAELHKYSRADHTADRPDASTCLRRLHPLASFTRRQLEAAEISGNLKFEPRDTIELYNAMSVVVAKAAKDHPIQSRREAVKKLLPRKFFGAESIVIYRTDVFRYEDELKKELSLWMGNNPAKDWSPRMRDCAMAVLARLGNTLVTEKPDDESFVIVQSCRCIPHDLDAEGR
jgi:ATP-dependent RNA helicase DDX60